MKSVFIDKEHCCGCSACYNICPLQAIEMKQDDEGFLYPWIDRSKCVNCRLCQTVCPFVREGHCKNQREPDFYVARHRSEETLLHSASGGAFTGLSDVILGEGGVVYGADFDEAFQVRHMRAENQEQRNRMRISKYAQSRLGDVFHQVRDDLAAGRRVLFSGTPCQNAGLNSYLMASASAGPSAGMKDLQKGLYLCDVICHSVPSPLIWEDFKALLEKDYGGSLEMVEFRTKKLPWGRENSKKTFTVKVTGDQREHIDNRFYRLFFGEMTIMRPSCQRCPFADSRRAGDVTIADYWGIEKYAPQWNDPLGASLILTSTEKGNSLLNRCQDSMLFEKRPREEELAEQPRLKSPVKYPESRSLFWEKYRKRGLEFILDELKWK